MKKYNKYKHSGIEWIGEIPEHWEVKRLGAIGQFSASGIDKHLKYNEKKVKIINFTDIFSNIEKILNSKLDYMVVTTPEENRKKHLVKKGDLIFLPSSETYEDLGLSALVDEELENTSFSYHVIRLNFNQNIYHGFKKYMTNNHTILEQFAKQGKGTTRKIIGRNVFRNIKIILPPLDEQKAIANFLDKKTAQINKAINQKEKLIKLLKEQKQTIINTAVTKGLNKNAKLTNSNIEWIGEIPENWKASKLKFVTKKIIDGTHFTPDYQDNGIVFLRVTDLQNKTIDLTKTKYISKEEHTELSKRCKAEKGDLLLSKNGTIGLTRVVDWDFEFSIFVSLCLIKINHNILIPKILEYQIRSEIFTQQLLEAGKTTSVTNLHLEMIKELKVLIPPLDIQVKIVKFLDVKTTQIDKAINLQTNYIEKLKEYKTSLIDSVVTGKVRVS